LMGLISCKTMLDFTTTIKQIASLNRAPV